jgi:uncharacterized protein YycO
MQTIRVIFTKREWNPVSWLIRWVLPRTRFYLAHSSHCLIVDGDHLIEAHMLYGVRREPAIVALAGLTIVKSIEYQVPDADAGLQWARGQCGKRYDFTGAVGIGLAPDRSWHEDDAWFCYELAAAAIVKAGRDIFADVGHISESALLAIKP